MTNLITAEGRAKLQEEYDFLWEKERPKVVREVSDAAAEGEVVLHLGAAEVDVAIFEADFLVRDGVFGG